VAATLVHRAVGDRLICVHVDHGMMRKNETELLKTAFEQLGVRVIVVNARERFLSKLDGVIDPEQKRHIIGTEFIRVFEEEAARLGEIAFLTQGRCIPTSSNRPPPTRRSRPRRSRRTQRGRPAG